MKHNKYNMASALGEANTRVYGNSEGIIEEMNQQHS